MDFAKIYGFQVDFQRDIRKRDKFQIMYEIFTDDNGKIIETGEILYANLKLTGQDNVLYFFDSKNNEGHYTTKMEKVLKSINENSNKRCQTFFTFWDEKTSN